MMKNHYSEADLLDTYYTQPGASLPVMMHLADCAECAARYEKLERKVRDLAACARHREDGTSTARPDATMRGRISEPSRSILRAASGAALALLVCWTLAWGFMQTRRLSTQPAALAVPPQSAAP